MSDKQYRSTEGLVYVIVSPEFGPQYRIYTEEDTEGPNAIDGIERVLEEQSYWFAQLGRIPGEPSACGITFLDFDIAKLSAPPDDAWRVGQRNPAFTGSDLGRQIFRTVFRAIERLLDFGKHEEDNVAEAYALKELKMSSETLNRLTNALHCVGEAHQLVEITVIKHWYDMSWPEPHLPADESVLEEYSTRIPLRMRWSAGATQLSVEITQQVLKLDINGAGEITRDRPICLQ